MVLNVLVVLFFYFTEQHFITDISKFIFHLFTGRDLSSFQSPDVIKKAAINVWIYIFLQTRFYFVFETGSHYGTLVVLDLAM